MSLEVKSPVLVVGIGGLGSRLAGEAGRHLRRKAGRGDIMVISNDESDLRQRHHATGPAALDTDDALSASNAEAVMVDTGAVVNPTSGLIRAAAYEKIDAIRECIAGHPTVILIGNLAGRAGCAISPVISEACASEGADLISLAVMPFGYEKSRLFASGVALKRLREMSACTVIIDNDSLLESNPDLTPDQCYEIADAAIMYMVSSIERTDLKAGTDNLLSASRSGASLEESLRDALKTLHGSGGSRRGAARHSMIYVAGGSGMPIGMLQSAAKITEWVLGGGGGVGANGNNGGTHASDPAHATAETVPVQAIATSGSSDESRVVMLSTVQSMEKFEAYDPLGLVIPKDKSLDWNTPECSIDCGLDRFYQME